MNGGQSVDVSANRGRFRISTLFWLQLVAAPAFMGPFYNSGRSVPLVHPDFAVVLSVLAPACYVLSLTAWSAWPVATRRRRSALSLIFVGAAFGTLFCVLAFGPLGIRYIVEFREFVWEPFELMNMAMVSALILAHGAMFGGVLGGIVGLTRGFFEWRQRSRRYSIILSDKRDS